MEETWGPPEGHGADEPRDGQDPVFAEQGTELVGGHQEGDDVDHGQRSQEDETAEPVVRRREPAHGGYTYPIALRMPQSGGSTHPSAPPPPAGVVRGTGVTYPEPGSVVRR